VNADWYDAPVEMLLMILLQPIIEILTCSMLDMVAHGLAYGTRIGHMAINRDLIGHKANHRNCSLKKPLSCFPISFLAQHRFNEIAILVDCPACPHRFFLK
jgi:hypothetical protein